MTYYIYFMSEKAKLSRTLTDLDYMTVGNHRRAFYLYRMCWGTARTQMPNLVVSRKLYRRKSKAQRRKSIESDIHLIIITITARVQRMLTND